MKEIIYLTIFIALVLGLIWQATQPTEAEYQHCLITSTEKSICESLKP